jgi:DNA mismatch repair protein MutS2
MNSEAVQQHGVARLHGVCHPVLLEPALAPLPPPPMPQEVFIPGPAPADVLRRMTHDTARSTANERVGHASWYGAEDVRLAAMPRPVDLRVPVGVLVAAVTGPNTGGKTAALKTLGISVLMAQAGMFLRLEADADDDGGVLEPPKVCIAQDVF